MRLRPPLLLALLALSLPVLSQELLKSSPRYEKYEASLRSSFQSIRRGDLSEGQIRWSEDGNTVYYRRGGKNFKFDIREGKESEGDPPATSSSGRSDRRPNPERGRQFSIATSPDGKLKAAHKNGNVVVSAADDSNPRQITSDGSPEKRIKNGIASWVYGEELGVREAMWWSPDSKMLAYYRFDESKIPDYILAMNQLDMVTKLDAEAYPKPGMNNPTVQLFVYHSDSGDTTAVDVKFDGGAGSSVSEYVYQVSWSPDGKELLYNRMNRKQNVMEFCAADPKTGKSRVIVRESWKTYVDPSPAIIWLDEKGAGPKRFLWQSERNGFANWYLYDVTGKLHNVVTKGLFDTGRPTKVDLVTGYIYYPARSSTNPYLQQLHRAKLDGSADSRLTNPEVSHTFHISPNGKYFVDIEEKVDVPPTSYLRDMQGKTITKLAESDVSGFTKQNLKHVEVFQFKSADGAYMLYGKLEKPSDFDPNKKYPLLVSCYAGPESGGSVHRFDVPNPMTELGFLVASFEGRGTTGRGKAFKDALYGKLGVVEVDDQAAGVKALVKRPYVDASKVGIFGTSYGGYTAALGILRHPDVFTAAVASSPVTDWRNYDTIYTERFMGLPTDSDNKAGYDRGSAMEYAANLKGDLMLFYGTADNNVHPSNTYQLVRALRRAGKRFSVMPGPDEGHSFIGTNQMVEFFLDSFGMTARK
jgi:dipeptidyl-peptidase-4